MQYNLFCEFIPYFFKLISVWKVFKSKTAVGSCGSKWTFSVLSAVCYVNWFSFLQTFLCRDSNLMILSALHLGFNLPSGLSFDLLDWFEPKLWAGAEKSSRQTMPPSPCFGRTSNIVITPNKETLCLVEKQLSFLHTRQEQTPAQSRHGGLYCSTIFIVQCHIAQPPSTLRHTVNNF